MADTMYENDDGIQRLLDATTGKGGGNIGGGTLRMFKNNIAVSKATVLANLTESTFPGYVGAALNTATWGAAAVAGHVAAATYGAAVTFTRNATGAPELAYGWYITDAANTKLYTCALFAAGPYTLTNLGDFVSVTPTLTHQSLN